MIAKVPKMSFINKTKLFQKKVLTKYPTTIPLEPPNTFKMKTKSGPNKCGVTGPSPLGSEAAQGDEGLAAPPSTAIISDHDHVRAPINTTMSVTACTTEVSKCVLLGPSPLGSEAAQGDGGLAAPSMTPFIFTLKSVPAQINATTENAKSDLAGPSPLRSEATQGDGGLTAPPVTSFILNIPTMRAQINAELPHDALSSETAKCDLAGPSPLGSEATQGHGGLAAPPDTTVLKTPIFISALSMRPAG